MSTAVICPPAPVWRQHNRQRTRARRALIEKMRREAADREIAAEPLLLESKRALLDLQEDNSHAARERWAGAHANYLAVITPMDRRQALVIARGILKAGYLADVVV